MTYTVKAGDTLGTIASKLLGSSSRYTEILKLNPQITNPNLIRVGAVLKIPSTISSTPTAMPTSSLPKLSGNSKYVLIAALMVGAAYFISQRKKLAA